MLAGWLVLLFRVPVFWSRRVHGLANNILPRDVGANLFGLRAGFKFLLCVFTQMKSHLSVE